MIVVCEPQCKTFSHEKVNSGFIYGLRLAFPQEKIRFYADVTHIEAIKNILRLDGVRVGDIDYIAIEFGDPFNPVHIVSYYLLFKKIFSDTLIAGADKVFFLSFNPILLYLIKRLKRINQFAGIRVAFVLHGGFEEIANDIAPVVAPPKPIWTIAARFRRSNLAEIPGKAVRRIGRFVREHYRKRMQALLTKAFPIRKMLLLEHSEDFRYIALSPHIIVNAARYIDTKRLNVHTIMMPTAFAAPLPMSTNQFPKFAVLGYGDPSVLYQVLVRLSEENIQRPYEIRIIGMGGGDMPEFQNVTTPGHGRALSRADIEKYVVDIDIFLILYQKHRYRLSCSGSILEALSYMKPVLHFDNDSINTFNTRKRPIGISANTIDEYVSEMVDIIKNYSSYREKAEAFRSNITKLRHEFSIMNSATNIRSCFTWSSAQ